MRLKLFAACLTALVLPPFSQVCAQSPILGFNSTSPQTPLGADGKVVMTLFSNGSVGVGTDAPHAVLDVEGETRIGNSGVGCTQANEGSLRYVTIVHTFQYCDGTSWQNLGMPSGAVVAFNSDACPAGWIAVPALSGSIIAGDGPYAGGGSLALNSSGIVNAVTPQSLTESGVCQTTVNSMLYQPIPWYALHYCMKQ